MYFQAGVCVVRFSLSYQTFRNRLTEVVDQAQHFAALGAGGGGAAGGGPQSTAAQAFREGLDATERESQSFVLLIFKLVLTEID